MSLKCGIVGLPNVGKSTLFNAVTNTSIAEAANYPFCTIEPNIGKVNVPDPRLIKLAEMAQSAKIIPTQIEFVDIAGLVKGASKGEGLGNQFLGHIREVDAIIYVLRCFEDGDITHVEGSVDPIRDAEIIEMELMLADLESLTKRLPNLEKKAKTDKAIAEELLLVKKAIEILSSSNDLAAVRAKFDDSFAKMQLLTPKPILYVCNVGEDEINSGNQYSETVANYAKARNAACLNISAKIEAEIAQLSDIEERQAFLSELGLKETGLDKLIRVSYDALGLITFFTVGPKEAHAWEICRGTQAPKAAGVIHTDFERGFIRAETIAYEDYVKFSGESGARDAGKLRVEGKEYVVEDGDILHFRFNT